MRFLASSTRLSALLVGLMLVAACGDDDDPPPPVRRGLEGAGAGAKRADASRPSASWPSDQAGPGGSMVRGDGGGIPGQDAATDASSFDGGLDASGGGDRDATPMPMPIEDANVRSGTGGASGVGGRSGEGGGAAVGGFQN